MNLRSTMTKSVVGLAAAGVASAGLVAGATTSTAAPAPAPSSLATTYLCSNSIVQGQAIDTTFTVTLPRKVKAGSKVKPLAFDVDVTVPETLTTLLNFLMVTEISGTSTGSVVKVGRQGVKIAKVTIPPTAVPTAGSFVLNGAGKSRAFKAGKKGTYPVKAPTSFVADLRDQDDESLPGGPLSCEIAPDAPTKIGTLRVVRR